eukprot:3350213-Pyramimonas_sp.AAC.1
MFGDAWHCLAPSIPSGDGGRPGNVEKRSTVAGAGPAPIVFFHTQVGGSLGFRPFPQLPTLFSSSMCIIQQSEA